MTIEFKCECGEIFQVGDEFAGRKGRCPSCKSVMRVPEKEPEPLELHEEVPEDQATEEIEALQGWDEAEAQAGLEDVERTIEHSDQRPTYAGLLGRFPKPLLFGVPALVIVLVGLFLLLKPSSDTVQRSAASKSTKEKAPAREEASVQAPAAKPAEPVPTAIQEKPAAAVNAAPEPAKSDHAPSVVPAPASATPEEKPPAVQAPPTASSPVPVPSSPSRVSETKASKSTREKAQSPTAEPQTSASAKPPSPAGSYTVNVGAFRSQGMADAYAEVLKKRGLDSFVWATDVAKQGKMYRVSVGRHATRKQADAAAKELREKENLRTYVVKIPHGQG